MSKKLTSKTTHRLLAVERAEEIAANTANVGDYRGSFVLLSEVVIRDDLSPAQLVEMILNQNGCWARKDEILRNFEIQWPSAESSATTGAKTA